MNDELIIEVSDLELRASEQNPFDTIRKGLESSGYSPDGYTMDSFRIKEQFKTVFIFKRKSVAIENIKLLEGRK